MAYTFSEYNTTLSSTNKTKNWDIFDKKILFSMNTISVSVW